MQSPELNETYYQEFWQWYSLDNPKKWPQWQILKRFLSPNVKLLEIGAGLRPRIPTRGSYFADISLVALARLYKAGGYVIKVNANEGMPFLTDSFDVICAFEILEHLDYDQKALTDIGRVLKPTGRLFVSFPLHRERFNSYDEAVGHKRRYAVSKLAAFFHESGLAIETYATQDPPWPDDKLANVATFLTRFFPWVLPITAKFLDSLPSSAIRQPLELKSWNFSQAKEDLTKVSTGFFVLKKV